MAEISFSYIPDYEQEEADPTLVEPTVTHTFTLPKGCTVSNGLSGDAIQYHFNMWLRGLGYHVND